MIEREIDLVTLEDIGIGYLQDFTNRGWISLTIFKVESILTFCQIFMENIKHRPMTEKGKEKLISWVRGKKLSVRPDTFAKIFEILLVENPEFEFSDVGMPDLSIVSHKLLLEGDEWDG